MNVGMIKAQEKQKINGTLKGVLLNNCIKQPQQQFNFNEIENSLLIYNPTNTKSTQIDNNNKEESCFNVKNAIKPLLIGTGIILSGCAGLSIILKKSSNAIFNSKSFEQLPDLAVNMNIKEEPQFALYRAIRDPNFKNILGAAAVFLMSAITITATKFVDGVKEIWTKKKSADIEKYLQENLIDVERQSFSGKLDVVNELMNKNIKHFDFILNNEQNSFGNSNLLNQYISFKNNPIKNKNKDENTNKKEMKNNIKYIALTAGVVISAILLGKYSISNIRKTAQATNNFANNITEATIESIKKMSQNSNNDDIPQIIEMLKSICAKPEFVKEIGQKYNLSNDKIQEIINSVETTKKMIFADAPTALGGIPKKIQYYCYIDENRGHLYNWVLNPKNKFTRYIFHAFTLSSAIGYIFKQAIDAIKDVAVLKENAKTELNLRKRLVDVEIRNFKAKKESAINPLIENFDRQATSGNKSKEELKQLADNILFETKNGPPYVYA